MKNELLIFISLIIFPVILSAQAIDESEFFDPGFVFEMVDPGFCEVPPADVTDADIIAMLNMHFDEIPLRGELTGPISGKVYGGGYYKKFYNGLVASFNNYIILADDEVLSLCMVVVPVKDTDLTEGTATLVGPAPDSIDGQTFLAIIQIAERDDTGLKSLGTLVGGTGSITFVVPSEDILRGNLDLTGRIDGISADGELDFHLSFEFDDMLENPLRNIRWNME